jgi:tetratricopeptide (TPR) repeat protein
MLLTSFLRIIAGIAIAASLSAGLLFAQQNVREIYERARMLDESNKNLSEAIKLYDSVVMQTQDRALAARALYRVGLLYERIGNNAQALRAYRMVITRYSDEADVAQRAQDRVTAVNGTANKGSLAPRGPAGLRFSVPLKESEEHSSRVFQQWLNQHPDIIRTYGLPKTAKFVSVWEQPFKGGLIVYNVTDGWSVLFFRRSDGGGAFKQLSNGENLTPGVGRPKVDEEVFAEITKGMTEPERNLYRSLVDSRVNTPDSQGIGLIGGIATLYIMNRAYSDVGAPFENERFLPDIVYAQARGYKILADLPHSVGQTSPESAKSVYVLYPNNTYRRHIVFPQVKQ